MLVLVTGGSGFVGSHCISQLLPNYSVRTTVRSSSKEQEVRQLFGDRVEIVKADLTGDWSKVCDGCDYVLHVASPFTTNPTEGDVKIAVDGTLNVLRAAHAAKVKRVVMTSSIAAIAFGQDKTTGFTEDDWTNPDRTGPYERSKTLAERAAWDFAKENGLDLVVINPVGIFGPILSPTVGTSVEVVKRLLQGIPAVPNLQMSIVDVRDVAALHILAMTKGSGRYLALDDTVSIADVARVLGLHVRLLPNWLTRFLARFISDLALTTEHLEPRTASNERAKKEFDFKFRSWEEAVKSCAESLKEHGVV